MQMHAEVQHVTHEAERVPRGGILWITLCTLAFASLLGAISVVVWNARTSTLEPSPPVRGLVRPGAAVSNVRTDTFARQGNNRGWSAGAGESLRAKQRAGLERFEWADSSRTAVRLPIGEAIDLELGERR